MLNKLYRKAMESSIVEAVLAMNIPKNMRQHYANKVMYIRVCIEYNVSIQYNTQGSII